MTISSLRVPGTGCIYIYTCIYIHVHLMCMCLHIYVRLICIHICIYMYILYMYIHLMCIRTRNYHTRHANIGGFGLHSTGSAGRALQHQARRIAYTNMYMYITNKYTHTHTYIYMYVYMYIYIYINAALAAHYGVKHDLLHTHMYICYTQHTHVNMYVYVHVYKYIHIYKHSPGSPLRRQARLGRPSCQRCV